jgi:hypothetical protein
MKNGISGGNGRRKSNTVSRRSRSQSFVAAEKTVAPSKFPEEWGFNGRWRIQDGRLSCPDYPSSSKEIRMSGECTASTPVSCS